VPEVRQARLGPGRLLVAVYAVFAVSATARSTVQIATSFGDAPVAYLLSALAAAVYVVATIALARGALLVALTACGVELAGVVVVGAASLLVPEAFPDATVWSVFGSGYGFVPLVLPVVGLWWVLHVRRAQQTVRSE
jgi:hypothetical protein